MVEILIDKQNSVRKILSNKGVIVIPFYIRKTLNLEKGDFLEFKIIDYESILIKKYKK